ncbi:MAG: acetyl-CoA carboxylase biotin carboxyl carrier protein subunit [Pseudomonadota bacterium]
MPRRPVEAHVAGAVWKLPQTDGAQVAQGAPVAVLECMKMEIPVKAPAAGRLALACAEGDAVEEGDVLAWIET